MGSESTENSRSTTVKFLEVVQSGETHVVPDAAIDNIEAYPVPKNVKEVQDLLRVWGYIGEHLYPT